MLESLAGGVFRTVHHVAGALESVYQLWGYSVVQSNGATAGQDVFHAYVHIIPRYENMTVDCEQYDPPCRSNSYSNRVRYYMVSLRSLAVNAIVGLVILFVANTIGLGVQISLVTLLLCAILGIPGAILVIVLSFLDVAFMAALFPAVPTVPV